MLTFREMALEITATFERHGIKGPGFVLLERRQGNQFLREVQAEMNPPLAVGPRTIITPGGEFWLHLELGGIKFCWPLE